MALAIVPLLMAVAGLTFATQFGREAAQRAAIHRAYDTRFRVHQVLSTLKDAETSQNAYLITGAAADLSRNREFVDQIDQDVAAVRRLVAGDPPQVARLDRLAAQSRARLAEINEVIRLRRQSGYPAAAERLARGPGETLMNDVRAQAEAMVLAQDADIQRRLASSAQQAESARTLMRVTFLLAFFGIIGAGGMALYFARLRFKLIRQTQAEASRRLAVFEAAMDTIITLNPSGGLESINRAGERLFGYTEAELLGRDISVLVPLATRGEGWFLNRLSELEEGQAHELEGRRKDGSTFTADVNFGKMAQPDGEHVVAIIRDSTERKRAERDKNEFISTVSHELRTPLTSIAGSLGLMTAGAAGELPERAQRLLTIADNNSRRLVRLINDILDIEKFQSGMMNFDLSVLDLNTLTQRSVEDMGGFVSDLGVRIVCKPAEAAVKVRGDSDRLTQVLANLLSNAAKFSPPGQVVEVEVSAVGGRARISVRDHGPGIPGEFHGRIFGKFAQSDSSSTRQKGGTGLGLAISKQIVEGHGGRIWFESVPGEGAVFHVELPLEDAVSDPQDARFTGPRLLLCEDDPDITRVLVETLNLQGFQVTAVGTLAEAQSALAAPGAFAALLLDLHLPDGDGLDLVRQLRGQAMTRNLPVIIVSASSRAASACGFDIVDWIQKPVDLGRLRASLEAVISVGQQAPLILHVDDDPDLRRLVEEAFGDRGRVMAAASLSEARRVLGHVTPQLVILDVGLPDGSGLDLLPDLVTADGQALPVVIFSAQSFAATDLSAAVDAVLTKSRTSLEQLVQIVRLLSRERGPATGRRA